MKKSLKIILIVVGVLVGIVILDTLQAIIFNNSPLLKIRKDLKDGYVQYVDKGIFVNHYQCSNGEKITTWKDSKYACPIEENKNINIQNKEISWEEITTNGVNEELLINNVDKELLNKIATELQTLIEEETQEEREKPELVITEGWTRIFEKERYKKVLAIGTDAMKPLYLILYKSSNAGLYEYLCASILYDLSGYDFEWADSKEFLEKFNYEILKNKQ